MGSGHYALKKTRSQSPGAGVGRPPGASPGSDPADPGGLAAGIRAPPSALRSSAASAGFRTGAESHHVPQGTRHPTWGRPSRAGEDQAEAGWEGEASRAAHAAAAPKRRHFNALKSTKAEERSSFRAGGS